jgi:hypothetical protein
MLRQIFYKQLKPNQISLIQKGHKLNIQEFGYWRIPLLSKKRTIVDTSEQQLDVSVKHNEETLKYRVYYALNREVDSIIHYLTKAKDNPFSDESIKTFIEPKIHSAIIEALETTPKTLEEFYDSFGSYIGNYNLRCFRVETITPLKNIC